MNSYLGLVSGLARKTTAIPTLPASWAKCDLVLTFSSVQVRPERY